MDPSEGVQLPLALVDDDVPIQTGNIFVVQHQADEFIVTVGQMAPPVLGGGTPEEKIERAREIPFVPVRVLGRYGLSRQRVEQLIDVLKQNLEKFDAKQERGREK